MDQEKVLTRMGLSPKEAQVYLCLLKQGECTAATLAKEMSIHRRTIYDALDSLKKRGLVTCIKRQNIQQFNAESPSKLVDFLKQTEDDLESILPVLQRSFNQRKQTEPGINILSGLESVKKMSEEMLRSGKEIRLMGRGGRTLEFLKGSKYQYIPKLKSVKWRMIQRRTSEIKDYLKYFKKAQIRYVPKGRDLPCAFITAGDTVFLTFKLTPEHYVLEINDKAMAKTFSEYFDLLWTFLK